jgi:tetratricopeptide (TPR) repeat protein
MSVHRHQQQQLIRQAEGYLELGMYEHALAIAERVDVVSRLTGGDAKDPGEAEDHNQLLGHAAYIKGEALRSLERYEEALVPLLVAAKRSPDDIHVWLAIGWCYKRTGRLNLAIGALDAALATDPGNALLHYNLACYWSLSGEKDRVLEYLGEALEIDDSYRLLIDEEPDFDPLRNDRDFLALTSVIV